MSPSAVATLELYRNARMIERDLEIARHQVTAALARLDDVEFKEYISAVSEIEHDLQDRMRHAFAARREGGHAHEP